MRRMETPRSTEEEEEEEEAGEEVGISNEDGAGEVAGGSIAIDDDDADAAALGGATLVDTTASRCCELLLSSCSSCILLLESDDILRLLQHTHKKERIDEENEVERALWMKRDGVTTRSRVRQQTTDYHELTRFDRHRRSMSHREPSVEVSRNDKWCDCRLMQLLVTVFFRDKHTVGKKASHAKHKFTNALCLHIHTQTVQDYQPLSSSSCCDSSRL